MYLFLDCETGGLETHNSLLTVAAIVADKQFNPLRGGNHEDTLYLEIQHPTYIVTPGALAVNKVDLVAHDSRGVPLEKAQQLFADFVHRAHKMSAQWKLIPGGHNLAFDMGFIWSQLMFEEEWKNYCTYPAIDTAILAQFFKSTGTLRGKCNLTAVCNALGIPLENAHNSLADVAASLAIARKLAGVVTAASSAYRPAEAGA